jgi:hypothetical protein
MSTSHVRMYAVGHGVRSELPLETWNPSYETPSVFLIQNTQNRDSVAIQLKLDELLRGVVGARTSLVDLENLSDEDLALLHQQFARLHVSAAKSEQDATEKAAVDGRKEIDPSWNRVIVASHKTFVL